MAPIPQDIIKIPFSENDYIKFLGYRVIPQSPIQEIEYHILIKKKLNKKYVFFEHFVDQLNNFYSFVGYEIVPTIWKNGDVCKFRLSHYLAAGEYSLGIGFARSDDRGHLQVTRLEFENFNENIIPLQNVLFSDVKKDEAIAYLSKRSQDQSSVLNDLRIIAFPVYISESGPVASLNHGNNRNKTVVISIPKAGTYLVAEILEKLNVEDTGLHVSLDHVEDYRFADLKDANKVRKYIAIETTINLIKPGQYIVGHIPYCLQAEVALHDFKKIFVFRSFRDIIVSALRSAFITGSQDPIIQNIKKTDDKKEQLIQFIKVEGAKLFEEIKLVIPWSASNDVLKVEFEKLIGDYGKEEQLATIKKILDFIGYDGTLTVDEILSLCIEKETLTWSGGRTKKEDYWSDIAESLYTGLGFQNLELMLEKNR